jgi:hypothetical protein
LSHQARKTVWSTAADAFVSIATNGAVELWAENGDRQGIISPGPYPADAELKLSEDTRFAFVWTRGRDNVRIADLSRQRWRGELLVPRPTELFPARDFVYVRSSSIAENLVVPMESIRGSQQVQGRRVAGGTTPHPPSRFSSITSLPGAEIVFWTAAADDQVYAYHPGMNAASGGLRVPGKPIGLMLAGPPLVERKPGEFRAEFTLPEPGKYIAVLASQQPKRQVCTVFQVAGEPSKRLGRFRVDLLTSAVRQGTEQTIQMKLHGTSLPSQVRMLVLAIDGQWQNRYHVSVDADGACSIPLTLPRSGKYWLIFDIPSEPLSHSRFPRLDLEAID